MGFIIRTVRPEDIDSLIGLCEAHAHFEGCEYDRKNKSERLESFLFGTSPPVSCLVVQNNDSLVGYTTFMREFSTWDAAWYLHMDCLYLKEEVRGKGIGKFLMEKIHEVAIEQNCINVQWQTPLENVTAIKFYQRFNVIVKSKKRFYWQIPADSVDSSQ